MFYKALRAILTIIFIWKILYQKMGVVGRLPPQWWNLKLKRKDILVWDGVSFNSWKLLYIYEHGRPQFFINVNIFKPFSLIPLSVNPTKWSNTLK